MKISKGSWHYKLAEKTHYQYLMHDVRTPCSYMLLVLRGIFKIIFNKLVSILALIGWLLAHVVLFATMWVLFFTKIDTLTDADQWMFVLGMTHTVAWSLVAILVYYMDDEYVGAFAMSKKYRKFFTKSKFTDKLCGTIEYID